MKFHTILGRKDKVLEVALSSADNLELFASHLAGSEAFRRPFSQDSAARQVQAMIPHSFDKVLKRLGSTTRTRPTPQLFGLSASEFGP